METFVISDTHFGHSNVIRHDGRPFKNIGEHDCKLIENWNLTVTDKDIIYHLGDFFWNKESALIFNLLNFKQIRVIEGNHDKNWNYKNFHHPKLVKIRDIQEVKHNKKTFVMSHYPLFSWNKRAAGSIHIYGHSHYNSLAEFPNTFCASCNTPAMAYFPRTLDFILNEVNNV